MTSYVREVPLNPDSSRASTARPLAKSTKIAISVLLLVAVVCAVLVVEIDLLDSGVLVVVMPE